MFWSGILVNVKLTNTRTHPIHSPLFSWKHLFLKAILHCLCQISILILSMCLPGSFPAPTTPDLSYSLLAMTHLQWFAHTLIHGCTWGQANAAPCPHFPRFYYEFIVNVMQLFAAIYSSIGGHTDTHQTQVTCNHRKAHVCSHLSNITVEQRLTNYVTHWLQNVLGMTAIRLYSPRSLQGSKTEGDIGCNLLKYWDCRCIVH